VLDDFFEIAGQRLHDFIDLGTSVVAEGGYCRRCCLFQLIQKLDREICKVVDEIERVLDLVGDAGSQLAECCHLLGMQQARLRRLQVAQRPLGGVPCGLDLRFGGV